MSFSKMLAIIPAAGLGTRMAALTGGAPKELLVLGRRTVLERAIDEAIEAGADEVIVVSSANKPQIEEAMREWAPRKTVPLGVAYQAQMRGLADALLTPGRLDDTLVLMGDSTFQGPSPLERMANLIFRGIDGCIAVETVPDSEVSRYGICEINDLGSIVRIVEKPKPEEVESRWAVAGRYAFSSGVMSAVAEYTAEALEGSEGHEVPLTPILQRIVRNGFELKAVALLEGQERVDCGTPEEYQSARLLPWD